MPWYSPLFPSLSQRLLALLELALPVKLVATLEMANLVVALTQVPTVAPTTLIVALMATLAIFPRDNASREPLPWYSPLSPPSLCLWLAALLELALPVKLVATLEMANLVVVLTPRLIVALTTLIVALMDTPVIFPRDNVSKEPAPLPS